MTLTGVWTNEYGSRMELWMGADSTILGRYTSTTGSSGEYPVSGHAGPGPAGPAAGQALALAISWRSLVAGAADPSWEWCSALSGQVSLRDGAPVMVLTHALVASGDFPDLARAGIHTDRLTYRRVAEAGPPRGDLPSLSPTGGPLEGGWQDENGDVADLRMMADAGFDRVRGRLRRRSETVLLDGFAGHGPVRSLALTGRLADGSVTALAGNLGTGAADLSLIGLTSSATPPGSAYLQTMVNARRWRRVGQGNPMAPTAG